MHARSRDPNLLFSSGSIATLIYNNQLYSTYLTYRYATSKYRAVRIFVSFNQSPSLVCNRDVSHPLKKACTTDRQPLHSLWLFWVCFFFVYPQTTMLAYLLTFFSLVDV